MAKINKPRGAIRGFTVAVGAYSGVGGGVGWAHWLFVVPGGGLFEGAF